MTVFTTIGDYCEDIGNYVSDIGRLALDIPVVGQWIGYHCGSVAQKCWYSRNKFYSADTWGLWIQNMAQQAIMSVENLWDWRDIIEYWRNDINAWWGTLKDLAGNLYFRVREQLTDEIDRIDDLWNRGYNWITDSLGTDWTDLLNLLNNWEEWVSTSILGAYSSLDSWFDDQEIRVDGWIQDRRSIIMDWVDDRKEDIQGWAEENVLSWGKGAQDAIYGFVVDRIDDLEERIRMAIEKKIETTAEWWWALGEKILKHV